MNHTENSYIWLSENSASWEDIMLSLCENSTFPIFLLVKSSVSERSKP